MRWIYRSSPTSTGDWLAARTEAVPHKPLAPAGPTRFQRFFDLAAAIMRAFMCVALALQIAATKHDRAEQHSALRALSTRLRHSPFSFSDASTPLPANSLPPRSAPWHPSAAAG